MNSDLASFWLGVVVTCVDFLLLVSVDFETCGF
jgi:hypothetical protein